MYIIVMYVIMRIDSVIFIPYLFLIAERCVSAMKKKVLQTWPITIAVGRVPIAS